MTELHLYIAEDGTEFEDEQECLAYEAAQSAKTLKGKVVLLDRQSGRLGKDFLHLYQGCVCTP